MSLQRGEWNRWLLVGVTCLEHGRKAGRFHLAPFFGAGFFKTPMQTHLLQGLFAVQFLFQPAESFIDRFTFFKFNFRHNG